MTRTQTTQLHQSILPIHRRLSLQCSSHTLTGGRNKPSHAKTHSTTHCLLLHHVYPHRKKLRHLQAWTTHSHQSPNTLATSPRSHKRPSHHPNWPCKPHILENAANHQQKSRQMVHRTPRLHLIIKHVPRKTHAAADMLSRPPGVDKGEDDNTDITLLPEPIFVRLADEPDPKWTLIKEREQREQQKQPQLMKEWHEHYQLEFIESAMEPSIRLWKHEGKRVFPPNDELRRDLPHLIHNKLTATHTGQDWTTYTAKRVAWWPNMSKWIENYIKGCTRCQQNKTLTHWIPTPPYKINVPPFAQPFEVVTIDLITQLPNSQSSGKSQFTWASLKLLEPHLNSLKLAWARLAKCFLSKISS